MRSRNLKRLETDRYPLIIACAPGFQIDVRISLGLVCPYHEHSDKRSISAAYAAIPTSGRITKGLDSLPVAIRRAGYDT